MPIQEEGVDRAVIREFANGMITLLLAKFVLNDIPHALGLPGGKMESFSKIEAYCTPFIKQVNPGLYVRVEADPSLADEWPPSAYYNSEPPEHIVLVVPAEEDFWASPLSDYDLRIALAVVAHEAAHAELDVPATEYAQFKDIPLLEVEAIIGGIKWAQRWGIFDEYKFVFETRGVEYLSSFLEEPKFQYTEELLRADTSTIRKAIHDATTL